MDLNLNKAIDILKKNNQEHIIPFLENGNNKKLVNQILNIDFDEIKKLYKITNTEREIEIEDIKPIVALNPCKLPKDEISKLENIGTDIIKNGKFAVVTMAGGQGTRLRASKTKRNL